MAERNQEPGSVLAIAAHADDIEFMMGGTLALLGRRGWETHYLTVANGYAGTAEHSPQEVALIRQDEAKEGARLLGATWHPSLVNDVEIIYDIDLLRRVTAAVRTIRPTFILTQAPDDYMDDHIETSRLATSAAFNRGMPNFLTLPPVEAYAEKIVVYHALPHGLRDPLRRLVYPGIYVDISKVTSVKCHALEAHRSQQGWLGDSQELDEGLITEMVQNDRTVGRMSGTFEFAEGWRRHNHVGFAGADDDPLTVALSGDVLIDEDIESALTAHPVTGRRL